MNFYFDENIPGAIARAVSELERSATNYNVQHTKDAWGEGILDPELIRNLHDVDGILITNDLKMKKAYCEQLAKNKITAFFISFPSGASYENRYTLVINNWLTIKQISETEKRPFLCKIKSRGKPEISRIT